MFVAGHLSELSRREFRTTRRMRMLLTLKRSVFTDKSTTGDLAVDGQFEAFTLEDVARQKKIKHETCIPAGRYNVIINHSQRFNRDLPLLENVPNFDGIRIHPGNSDKDTSGCVLVGQTKSQDLAAIRESRLTLCSRRSKPRSTAAIKLKSRSPAALIKSRRSKSNGSRRRAAKSSASSRT